MELVSVIIVALVVQQAVEAIKNMIKIKRGYSLFKLINVKVLLSVIISILICVSSHIGILAMLGVQAVIPMVDYILTGLIVSGGASSIRELQKQIQNAKQGDENNELHI